MPALRRGLLLAVLSIAACATGGQRPRFGAAPEAYALLLRTPADTLVTRLDARVRQLGLRVVRSAPREGYLETDWFDVARRASAAPPYDRLDSIVKFRFFVDPTQGQTRLLAESMRRIAWDPSLPERELERMVPEGHPARVMLDSMLAPLRGDTARTRRGGPPLPEPPR